MENQIIETAKKIFQFVFHTDVNYRLEEIYEKLAFDVKLPYRLYSSISGLETWAYSKNFENYITMKELEKEELRFGSIRPKQSISSFDELISLWKEINYVTTERSYDSIEVSKSDLVYRSSNVYHSANISDCKNIIFCNGLTECEWMLASSRSYRCISSIRCDDSVDVTNSYAVVCSNKISNSFFIQDCANLNECMFCSHISNQRYCICNMQFSKEEYEYLKQEISSWILK